MPKMYKVMPWSPENTPQDLQAAIDELIKENSFEKDSDEESAARCLLVGLWVGHDHIWKVADFTGIPIFKVRKYAENLRKNGVWLMDGMTAADWDHETEGYMAFILDVLVAVGHIKRAEGGKYAHT